MAPKYAKSYGQITIKTRSGQSEKSLGTKNRGSLGLSGMLGLYAKNSRGNLKKWMGDILVFSYL